jgi:DNA-binding MarR family transcriptional regulator
LTRIALYTERDTDRRLKRYRLARSAFDVLMALRSSPRHRLSPTMLGRRQRMSSAGITGLVDQLAASGLVTRSGEPRDRRRVVVLLTRRGSDIVTSAAAAWRATQEHLERSIGAERARALDELLERLLAPLDSNLTGSPDGTSRALARIALHINLEAEVLFSRFGISHGGFQVLASLYRAGPPYRGSPSDVARRLMLSAAGLTGRMDQLERGRLLKRHRNLEDRRAVVVELTPAGRRLIRTVFPIFVASHARLLDQALVPEQQAAMTTLLRMVLKQFEAAELPGPNES